MSETIETASPAKADVRTDVKAERKPGAFVLAVCLAALAGWTDATGYIKFHGLFVSFMSGNATKVAAGLGDPNSVVFEAARSVLCFMLGVIAGELIGHAAKDWGRPVVLLVEALLLGVAAATNIAGLSEDVVASALALAMGVQNASVHKADGISVALTYVTGTFVHIGRAIASALDGTGRWGAILPFLGLVAGLFCGGVGGALLARRSPAEAIIVAAVVAALIALYTAAHRALWVSLAEGGGAA